MATNGFFQCEVEETADRDEYGNRVMTVKCHGRVVSETSSKLKNIVRPLIDSGGPRRTAGMDAPTQRWRPLDYLRDDANPQNRDGALDVDFNFFGAIQASTALNCG